MGWVAVFAYGTVRAGAAVTSEQVSVLKGSFPVERLTERLRSEG